MICLRTPSFGWSFQDGRQLASKLVHHNNELLDPVLFLRSVSVAHTSVVNHTYKDPIKGYNNLLKVATR